MRKLIALVLLIALAGVSTAQPVGKQINETNYEIVKGEIVQYLDERIDELLKFKKEVMNASSSEELKEILEKRKLEINKIKAMRHIDLAIKKLERVEKSIKNATSELKTLKESVKNANSDEELKEAMKKAKEIFIDLSKGLRGLKPKDNPIR